MMSAKPHSPPIPPLTPRQRADQHSHYFRCLSEWAGHLGNPDKREQLRDAEQDLAAIYIIESEAETR